MSPRRNDRRQLDLLDWQPTNPVSAFPAAEVRAASLGATISKAVSAALKHYGGSRAQVAQHMSEYLDEAVSEHMLNAYAAEARSEHVINVVRFIALLHVTRDRRLLEEIARLFDWAVIERRFLPAIELAELEEHKAEIEREADVRRRLLRKSGAWR